MNYVRLKSNLRTTCIEDRLRYNPEIIELHLEEGDIDDPHRIVQVIRYLQERGIKTYLHQPSKIKGIFLDILSRNDEIKIFYERSTRILVDICKSESVQSVIHAHYTGTESSSDVTLVRTLEIKQEIGKIMEYGRDVLLWEDTIGGLFSYANPYLISDLIKPLKLPLVVDLSHSFIALQGNNVKLRSVLEETKDYAQYFHVVDSMGEVHDGLELGQGGIDWHMVKSYVHDKPFIFEIGLEPPHDNCLPMIRSVEYYCSL